MKSFLFQTGVQAAIIALIWVLVARDATKVRDRNGTSPAGLSPFAWGAMCGLTWIALVPYVVLRKRGETSPPIREQNLLKWWIGLSVAAGAWSASNAADGDANNAAQHALLAGAFVVCALIAWSRDRADLPAPGRGA